MKSPAFQFYADDFVAGTCDLSAEEVGAYIRLLCLQWNRGSIPVQDRFKLNRIAGCTVTDDVLSKFPDGKNARLEAVREKQLSFIEMQRAKGIASGQSRLNRGSTAVQPNPEPKGNSPSPSPSITKLKLSNKAEQAPQVIPESLNRPDFAAAWSDWCAYRRERGQTLKSRTAHAQLAELAKRGPAAAIASIRQSIMQGWQGLFELRSNGNAPKIAGTLSPEFNKF